MTQVTWRKAVDCGLHFLYYVMGVFVYCGHIPRFVLRKINTLSRGDNSQICFASILEGVSSKMKESAHHVSEFFPFRRDPFQKGLDV